MVLLSSNLEEVSSEPGAWTRRHCHRKHQLWELGGGGSQPPPPPPRPRGALGNCSRAHCLIGPCPWPVQLAGTCTWSVDRWSQRSTHPGNLLGPVHCYTDPVTSSLVKLVLYDCYSMINDASVNKLCNWKQMYLILKIDIPNILYWGALCSEDWSRIRLHIFYGSSDPCTGERTSWRHETHISRDSVYFTLSLPGLI